MVCEYRVWCPRISSFQSSLCAAEMVQSEHKNLKPDTANKDLLHQKNFTLYEAQWHKLNLTP